MKGDVSPSGQRLGRHDAGELDLELDRAVQVEVPVEAVLVVADRRDEADDQATRAAHLGATAVEVDVLPEDSVVLFVNADRVLGLGRVAVLIGVDPVEVEDLAETVAAERERVRHAAEAPLARVERVLPTVHRRRDRRRARPSR